MGPLSARSTAPNQTLDSGPISTSPMRTAVGATNADGSILGCLPRNGMSICHASQRRASNLARMHRHKTPLRGVKAIPHPKPGDPNYTAVNYAYAQREGHVHEVVEMGGRQLAKVGFADRKIVYYFLDDL